MSASRFLLPEFDETNEPVRNWRKRSNRHLQLFIDRKYASDLQMALVEYVEAEMWGGMEKKPWVEMVCTELEVLLKRSRNQIAKMLDDAERRGLLESKQLSPRRSKVYRSTRLDQVEKYVALESTEKPAQIDDHARFQPEPAYALPRRRSRPKQLPLQFLKPGVDKPTYQIDNQLSSLVGEAISPNKSGDGFIIHIFLKGSPEEKKLVHGAAGTRSAFCSPNAEQFTENKGNLDLSSALIRKSQDAQLPKRATRPTSTVALTKPAAAYSAKSSAKPKSFATIPPERVDELLPVINELRVVDCGSYEVEAADPHEQPYLAEIINALGDEAGRPLVTPEFYRKTFREIADDMSRKGKKVGTGVLRHAAQVARRNFNSQAKATPAKPLTMMTEAELRTHLANCSPEEYEATIRSHPYLAGFVKR